MPAKPQVLSAFRALEITWEVQYAAGPTQYQTRLEREGLWQTSATPSLEHLLNGSPVDDIGFFVNKRAQPGDGNHNLRKLATGKWVGELEDDDWDVKAFSGPMIRFASRLPLERFPVVAAAPNGSFFSVGDLCEALAAFVRREKRLEAIDGELEPNKSVLKDLHLEADGAYTVQWGLV